jgi:enamine deaminase RidA (YjgF/YER057c/UK114 family)
MKPTALSSSRRRPQGFYSQPTASDRSSSRGAAPLDPESGDFVAARWKRRPNASSRHPRILEENGSSLSLVVKATVYIRDKLPGGA